jgi:hypothetical protein
MTGLETGGRAGAGVAELELPRPRAGETGATLHGLPYALLCARLAEDAERVEGPRLLAEAAEDAFYRELDRLCRERGAVTREQRLVVARRCWRDAGLGGVEFADGGGAGLTAVMTRSVLDEAWVGRWGRRAAPGNAVGRGFVAAVAAVCGGTPPRFFTVTETRALACGDEVSEFQAQPR